MAISDAFNPLRLSGTQGIQLSLLIMLKVLITIYRPDIVDKPNRVNPVPPSGIRKIYDYVIIGAGSAGSVIANRLSENGNWTILLLEAGPDEPLLADLPSRTASLANSPIDWQFRTPSSGDYCIGSDNHQCVYTRGKALGGSSVLNGMLYVRGNHKVYDEWVAQGNPGWDYNNVLPYFKKSEDNRIPELQDSPYHQSGGYLTVERFRFRTVTASYVVKANKERGLNMVDYNGAAQTGIMDAPGTVRDGLRCSTAKAFLRSASKRKNLDVSINTMVDRILIDETTNTAYGVQFHIDSQSYKVEARREVILSAGAIQSPQLLMLSGVGPKQHLEEMGIKVILDAPGVGENFHDHCLMGSLSYVINLPPNSTNTVSSTGEPTLMLAVNSEETLTSKSIRQFIVNRNGPLYAVAEFEIVTYNTSKYANTSEDFPDVQIFWSSSTETTNDGGSRILYAALTGNVRPRSTGYIKLSSNDSSAQPIIVPNFFSDPRDLDVLVEGMKMAHSLKDTKIMRELNATANKNSAPDCDKYEYESDDYWKCLARYFTVAGLHASGTCKMGPASDKMAVVDPRLRVHGVKNLRVIDASIMPSIPNGNVNAPTIMVAEKGADLIKEDAAEC